MWDCHVLIADVSGIKKKIRKEKKKEEKNNIREKESCIGKQKEGSPYGFHGKRGGFEVNAKRKKEEKSFGRPKIRIQKPFFFSLGFCFCVGFTISMSCFLGFDYRENLLLVFLPLSCFGFL